MEEQHWKGFYTCTKCTNKFETINAKEWQQQKCPQCQTDNFPQFEVTIFELKLPNNSKRFNFYSSVSFSGIYQGRKTASNIECTCSQRWIRNLYDNEIISKYAFIIARKGASSSIWHINSETAMQNSNDHIIFHSLAIFA